MAEQWPTYSSADAFEHGLKDEPNDILNDLFFPIGSLDPPITGMSSSTAPTPTVENTLTPVAHLLSSSSPPTHLPSVVDTPEAKCADTDTLISVSTAFHPSAHPLLHPSDTLLVSTDGVLFYVHSTVILKASASAFETVIGGLLDDTRFRDTAISVTAPSTELNIVLHALYDLSPAKHSPTLDSLISAVDMMPSLSILPLDLIRPDSHLNLLFLSIAPLQPLEIYILAAHHNVHHLAVNTSAYLLSYPLETITDEQAERMGAIYLRRILHLRVRRQAALKNILLHAPIPHAPTKKCGFVEQGRLTRAWAIATAYAVWDSRLDLSTYSLESTLRPLTEDVDCLTCKELLQARIKDVILRWTAVEASEAFSMSFASRRFI